MDTLEYDGKTSQDYVFFMSCVNGVTERVALILLANFSLNIIGSHVLTRTIFIPVFIYLLIKVHSGVDLDWQYDKILTPNWGAGPRKHATHHRDRKRFYQPFFCWWDNWLESPEKKQTTKSRIVVR